MPTFRAAAATLIAVASVAAHAQHPSTRSEPAQSSSNAQPYASRPVRIVTATPGGGNDYLARIVATPLSGALGQQVIVDNRASRLVGGIVARSTPDGYTLAVGGGTMQFLPLMEKTDYDVLTDF